MDLQERYKDRSTKMKQYAILGIIRDSDPSRNPEQVTLNIKGLLENAGFQVEKLGVPELVQK